jgi:hypothetical protein
MDGRTAQFTRNEKRAQNPAGHAPVVVAGALKANDGTYPTGCILKFDADGVTRIPFVTAGNAVAGVLDQEIDTTKEASGNILVHGAAVLDNLLVKDGNGDFVAPSAADLAVLQASGVFAS